MKRGLNIERTRELFRDAEKVIDLPLLQGNGSDLRPQKESFGQDLNSSKTK